MKLTILRLQHLPPQAVSDLQKIWPACGSDAFSDLPNQPYHLYVARFNERLLAAVCVITDQKRGELRNFVVREETRRRGVGHYLLQQTMQAYPAVKQWIIPTDTTAFSPAATAFLSAEGFTPHPEGWKKHTADHQQETAIAVHQRT